MLVHAGVSDNFNLIDGSRFAFVHTHLKVDRVILHRHLYRLDIKEEISAICIEFAHGIIITRQTVVEGLEVVDITRFHTQCSIQQLIGIDGIAYPFDGADIILVALADGHIYVNARRVLGIRNHAIGYDIGITVTVFIIFLDNRLLVFLVFFGNEFLGAEEVDDIVIIGLLHRLVNLAVCQCMIARDVKLTDLGLCLLIHGY